MRKLTIILASVSMLAVSGCAITTAGVKKGDERNMARSINDVSAGRVISARMSRAYDFDLDKVDVEVAEGIAVLTGNVPTEQDKVEAERIAWSGPNVLQVGNEITVGKVKRNIIDGGKDTFLGSAIRTRLIAEKDVRARNVNIETVNGTVYLLGVARNTAELERVTYIASTTKGVKEVVSYMRIADRPVIDHQGQSSAYGANVPQLPAPGGIQNTLPQNPLPQSAQRELPDFLTTTPYGENIPSLPSTPAEPAPNEPFYRDPATGERIFLPPGTKTIPYDPNQALDPSLPKIGDAPYYIDPSNGRKVQIVWTGG